MLTKNEFYTIADLLPEPCLLLCDKGMIHAMNTAASEILAYSPTEASKMLIDMLCENNPSQLIDYLADCKFSGEMRTSKSFSFSTHLGDAVQTRLEGCLAHYNSETGDTLLFIRCIDLCSSVKYTQSNSSNTSNDPAGFDFITTLPNKKYFYLTLKQEWSRACRHQEPISMVLIKIDYFEEFKTTYGELASNACLQALARTMNSIPKRTADYLASLEQGTFAVLLPNTSLQGAIAIAEKVRHSTQRLNISNSVSRNGIITVCAGVSTLIPSSEKQIENLIEEAEIGLEKAQAQGCDRVQIPAGSLVSYTSYKSKHRKIV